LLVVHPQTKTNHRDQQGNRCHTRVREVRHDPPFAVLLVTVVLNMANATLGNAHIRHDQDMQHQVGDDDERHTQAGSNRQITDNVDLDEHQGQEAHRIGDQRQHAGNIQCTKSQSRIDDGIKTLVGLDSYRVHDLNTVTDAYREHQERYQYRIGVQTITKQLQSTQLPKHGNDRGEYRHQCSCDATGIPEQQERCQKNGNAGKPGNRADTFNQVSHFLGKANNVNADVRILLLVLATDFLFQLARELGVIQCLAGFRVLLVQRCINNR